MPDKAIDLIDEAASQIRMEIDSKPESMDKLDRKLVQLKIERMALKKEKDKASKKRLNELESNIKKFAIDVKGLAELVVKKEIKDILITISADYNINKIDLFKKYLADNSSDQETDNKIVIN